MRRYVVGACLSTLVAVFALAVLASPSLALVPDGAHGWFWQMPQPMGGSYADVAFGGAQDVWAVGGTDIVHSTDAGASWQLQFSFPRGELQSVAFADEKHGLACGMQDTSSDTYGPLLLRTDDGGVTWEEVKAAGVIWSLSSLSMSDADHAWMAGESGLLWTTADGGLTWSRHSLGRSAGNLSVATVDGHRGWAAGTSGQVWRTTNAGVTWKLLHTGQPTRFSIVQLQSADAAHVWAVALDESRPVPACRVLASSNGGASWRVVLATNQMIMDLRALSGSEAWLVSLLWTDPVGSTLDPGPTVASLRHTLDGGTTWTRKVINSSLSPWAVDGRLGALCTVGNGVLTSSDDGQHWLARTTGASFRISAASAVSATDVWAVDDSGSVVHSADGVSWVEQDVPGATPRQFDDVSFADADHGWIVGASGDSYDPLLLGTSDGGTTWTPSASALSGELTQVDFVDALHGWVAGVDFSGPETRTLERTTDGGAHWTLQQPDSGLTYIALIDFIDADTGWVQGAYEPSGFARGCPPEAVYRTTDGGVTWAKYPLAKNTGMSAMQFLSASDGWAIADRFVGDWDVTSSLVHTTDAGRTWTAVPRFTGHALSALHFLDATTGWLAVDGEGIYETRDGGTTWARVADDGGDALTIVAADEAHVWALGSNLVGTVDTVADTAPPTSWADADDVWHRSAQTVTLSASDVGGSLPVQTEYSLDGGATWQDGSVLPFDAPADHSGDGIHVILYRSRDAVGNQEATQACGALIDTLGPVCSAPKKAIVNSGAVGILRFKAVDATSGVRRATITITDLAGHVRRRFVERAGVWSSSPAPDYYWLPFTCNLKPGYYRIAVTAVDHAGNPQTTTGHKFLHVVRAGAPKQVRPWWPHGLPDSSMTGGRAAASSGARGRSSGALPAAGHVRGIVAPAGR